MEYSDLDPILEDFSDRYGLHFSTKYQDEEVRYTLIVDDAGNAFDLWVLCNGKSIAVSGGDRQIKGRTYGINTSLVELAENLEVVYARIEAWIKESGNTRTPLF